MWGFFSWEGKSANLTHFISPYPCKPLCTRLDEWVFVLFIIINAFIPSLVYLKDFWIKWPLVPTGQVTPLLVTTCLLSSLAHELRRSREAAPTWSFFKSLLHPKKSLVTLVQTVTCDYFPIHFSLLCQGQFTTLQQWRPLSALYSWVDADDFYCLKMSGRIVSDGLLNAEKSLIIFICFNKKQAQHKA